VGDEGELLIGGGTVMLGYWRRPELTAAVRIQNPLHQDFTDTVHRTGDYVRLRADGGFDFVGRRDHMVKTRGYRVELGEVETALLSHPAVQAVGVVALPDQEVGHTLHAAVALLPGAELSGADMISHATGRLQRHAVPSTVLITDVLPLTSTGKLDRQRLREIVIASQSTS
jgi:acyl-CoA synthetase (AMP-forming)/AMP-acid ligase II